MRKTAIFLFPVTNLTLPSCSSTLISCMTREFPRFGQKLMVKLHISHCACAEWPYFYFRSKIRRHHDTIVFIDPDFLYDAGISAILPLISVKFHSSYFSLRMRKTAIFLLPVKNLTSPSCSPTPISYMTHNFRRFSHK